MTPALAKICSEMEIRIVTNSQRSGRRLRPCETAAVHTITRILGRHGEGHLVMVLRTIIESENNNRELVAPVIQAVSRIILAHPDWAETGSAWLEAFDAIDLTDLRLKAKANKRASNPRDAIAAMLFERLKDRFEQPRLI